MTKLQNLLINMQKNDILNQDQANTLLTRAQTEQDSKNKYTLSYAMISIGILVLFFGIIRHHAWEHAYQIMTMKYAITETTRHMMVLAMIILMVLFHGLGFYLTDKQYPSSGTTTLHFIASALFIATAMLIITSNQSQLLNQYGLMIPSILGITLIMLSLLLRNGPMTLLTALGFLLIHDPFLGQSQYLFLYFCILMIVSAKLIGKQNHAYAKWLYIPGIIGLMLWLLTHVYHTHITTLFFPFASNTMPTPILLLYCGFNIILTLYVWIKQKNTYMTHFFFINIILVLLLSSLILYRDHIFYMYHTIPKMLYPTLSKTIDISTFITYFAWTFWGILDASIHEINSKKYLYGFLVFFGVIQLIKINYLSIMLVMFIMMISFIWMRKKISHQLNQNAADI